MFSRLAWERSDIEGLEEERRAYHVLFEGHQWLRPFRHRCPQRFLSLGPEGKAQLSTKQGIKGNQGKNTMLVLVNQVRLLSQIEVPKVCHWASSGACGDLAYGTWPTC